MQNIKILHGSESLDIPYIFDKVLLNNKHDILLFLRTIIDTRFLCFDKKCSLYELLYSTKTINDKQYQTNPNDLNYITLLKIIL